MFGLPELCDGGSEFVEYTDGGLLIVEPVRQVKDRTRGFAPGVEFTRNNASKRHTDRHKPTSPSVPLA